MRLAAAALVATLAATAACGGESASREDALLELGQETAIPSFSRFQRSAQALDDAIDVACRQAARELRPAVADELVAARRAWRETEAAWSGPVMDRRSWARIDYPADLERVTTLLTAAEPPTLDADYVGSRIGADQRGLGAIELVVADESLGTPERRCQYLRAAARVVSDEADAVIGEWKTDSPDSSVAEITVDDVVNDLLSLLEMMETELATATAATGGTADPTAIVEGPLGLGVSDLRARLRGLRAVLVGSRESGLAGLLDDGIVDDLDEQLAAADTAAAGLSGPLRTAAVDDRGSVVTVRERVEELERTVATQVVSHLGVTVGFSDTDGDTG